MSTSVLAPGNNHWTIARDSLGLGLRPAHYAALRERGPDVDFFEIISENYLGNSDLPRLHLDEISQLRPIAAHGVSLDLFGSNALDPDYLHRLRALVHKYGIFVVTDHLCWSVSGGSNHHDLLPVPCSSEIIDWAVDRIRKVKRALDVPFGIENVSTYLRHERDDLTEWEFLRQIVEKADCGILLDINNIYVSAINHGFDPLAYLAAIPWDRVFYVHIAGHETRPDGLRHDTHDRQVSEAVWNLYAEAWRLGGPFPTVLEWDEHIPPYDQVIDELKRALVRRS